MKLSKNPRSQLLKLASEASFLIEYLHSRTLKKLSGDCAEHTKACVFRAVSRNPSRNNIEERYDGQSFRLQVQTTQLRQEQEMRSLSPGKSRVHLQAETFWIKQELCTLPSRTRIRVCSTRGKKDWARSGQMARGQATPIGRPETRSITAGCSSSRGIVSSRRPLSETGVSKITVERWNKRKNKRCAAKCMQSKLHSTFHLSTGTTKLHNSPFHPLTKIDRIVA